MYSLLKLRDHLNRQTINDTIEEICRTGSDVSSKPIGITPIKRNIFDYSINTIFDLYLTLFGSKERKVKALSYYLIPVVTSLRYLLRKKIDNELFVSGNIYYYYISKKSTTKLYYYELKALIASSVAALTLTYLNKSSPYLNNMKRILDSFSSLSLNSSSSSSSSSSSITIEDNIRKTDDNINPRDSYNNIHNHMKSEDGKRSLQLKNYQAITNLQRNNTFQFKNAIQIYAEFRNVLIMNSYMLQILKITETLPSFWSFYSMYHYIWEGAYYSMIESFRNNINISFSSIINNLFYVDDSANSNNYINELEKTYSKILDVMEDLITK